MGLLDGEIKQLIGNAASGVFLDYKVIEPNEGGYNRDTQEFENGGNEIEHPCKGITSEYSEFERANTNVTASDRKILILASTLDVEPQNGWLVEDDNGQRYDIKNHDADPAGATWIIKGSL